MVFKMLRGGAYRSRGAKKDEYGIEIFHRYMEKIFEH